MHMPPLYWLYLGVALIVIEVMTPGLVSLFFGLAALTLALLTWLIPPFAGAAGWQWIVFSLLSVVYILLLRKSLKRVFNGDKEVSDVANDEFNGKLAVVVEEVAPNRPGRVEFQGSTWTAESGAVLPKGAPVRICGKRNLTLKVMGV